MENFDSAFGNPSAAWLRAWRTIDIFLGAHPQGSTIKSVICDSARRALGKMKNDTMSQLSMDNFSRAHLMSNELVQIQKLIGQSCMGQLATATAKQAVPQPLGPSITSGGPEIEDDTVIDLG